MKAIIMGASSGIGREVAKLLLADGWELGLAARREEPLLELKAMAPEGSRVEVMPIDVCRADAGDMLLRLADRLGGMDLYFHASGIGHQNRELQEDIELQTVETNGLGFTRMVGAAYRYMAGHGGGHIAVTTSIAGRFGFPLRCAYSSSKHALYGYFETLQAEYYDQGIRVTLVCPGRVRTNISLNALDKGGQRHGQMDPGQDGGLAVDKAAQQIVRAIAKCRREVLIGKGELIMVYIKRFFPGLCARLARRIKPM